MKFVLALTILLSVCNCEAAVSCADVAYGAPYYRESMDRLARDAKLKDGYWSRYHEDAVRMICKNGGKGLDQEIAKGFLSKGEVSRLITALVAPKPHHYVIERGGQYGYEPALSADDIRAGVASKPLIMVTYRGKDRAGAYHAMWSDGVDQAEGDCTAPCEFVHVLVLGPTVTPGDQTIRAANGSLIWAIFQDAMAGQLK